MKLKSISIVVVTILALILSANAQEWEPPSRLYQMHRTQVWANGTTPDGIARTNLSIRCYPGRRGYVSFEFIVIGARSMTGFNFGDFEGPAAPAMDKKLLTITVKTKRKSVVVKTSVAGGLSGEDPDNGAFFFNFGSRGKTSPNISRLIQAIINGASSISITVEDYRDRRKKIHAVFSTAKASDYVKQIMKRCSKP